MNNLKDYNSFVRDSKINEEFNPTKMRDWKKAGNSMRRGIGILNDEEAAEKGLEIVMNHPTRRRLYQNYLETDPRIADEMLVFYGKNPDVIYAGWDGEKWIDTSIHGSIRSF